MIKYAEFAPTQFDPRGLSLPERQDWFVLPIAHNRDSSPKEKRAFARAVKKLGNESETLEVHRFGHWACGWFEIAIIAPSREAEALKAVPAP